MSVLSSDTHPEIERMQIQLIRQMPAWKKMAIVDDLNETVRTLAISGIKQRHPDATPAEVEWMFILAKLEWYRLGGEISDRQWRDILGVLSIRAGDLDLAYLQRWATELQVADLLERALQASTE